MTALYSIVHFSVTSGGVYDRSFIASGIPVNEPKFLDTYQSTVFIGSPVPYGLGA